MQAHLPDIRCPRCRLFHPAGTPRCDCGWDLASGKVILFRSGHHVVTEDHATLPPRCVKCNAPASRAPIRFTFVDSAAGGNPHGAVSTILHFGTRRTARAYVSLCARHHRSRTHARLASLVLLLIAIAIGVRAVMADTKGVELFVVAIVVAAGAASLFGKYQFQYLTGRIRGREIWIEGAGTPFLDSLPSERPLD